MGLHCAGLSQAPVGVRRHQPGAPRGRLPGCGDHSPRAAAGGGEGGIAAKPCGAGRPPQEALPALGAAWEGCGGPGVTVGLPGMGGTYHHAAEPRSGSERECRGRGERMQKGERNGPL